MAPGIDPSFLVVVLRPSVYGSCVQDRVVVLRGCSGESDVVAVSQHATYLAPGARQLASASQSDRSVVSVGKNGSLLL